MHTHTHIRTYTVIHIQAYVHIYMESWNTYMTLCICRYAIFSSNSSQKQLYADGWTDGSMDGWVDSTGVYSKGDSVRQRDLVTWNGHADGRIDSQTRLLLCKIYCDAFTRRLLLNSMLTWHIQINLKSSKFATWSVSTGLNSLRPTSAVPFFLPSYQAYSFSSSSWPFPRLPCSLFPPCLPACQSG